MSGHSDEAAGADGGRGAEQRTQDYGERETSAHAPPKVAASTNPDIQTERGQTTSPRRSFDAESVSSHPPRLSTREPKASPHLQRAHFGTGSPS